MTPTPDMFHLIMIPGILLGIVQCFWGYRLFKVILGITGFIIGSALAVTLSYALAPQNIVVAIAGIAGGLIGASVLLTLYYVGIFCVGAILGSFVGFSLFTAFGTGPKPAGIIIAALVMGVLALLTQKYMIITSTSFGGAWLVVTGMAYIITGANSPGDIEYMLHARRDLFYILLFCWILLGFCGLIVQLKWMQLDLKRKERSLVDYVNRDSESTPRDDAT